MKQRALLIILLFVAILLGNGCTTTVINPGTDSSATYRMGKLTAQESQDIGVVYQAAEEAMSELGLNIIQKFKDKLEARIVARDAQDKKITVEFVALTKSTTAIKVRSGSSERAQRIYQTIHDNLP